MSEKILCGTVNCAAEALHSCCGVWLCAADYAEHRQNKHASANVRQVGGTHWVKQKIQTWDFILANDIPFLEGCAIKYLTRHRDKGKREDLEKALHYIQKAIEVYYP